MHYHRVTMKSILQFKMTVNHNVLNCIYWVLAVFYQIKLKIRLYFNHVYTYCKLIIFCFLSIDYRYMLSPNRRQCQASRQKYRKFGCFSPGTYRPYTMLYDSMNIVLLGYLNHRIDLKHSNNCIIYVSASAFLF